LFPYYPVYISSIVNVLIYSYIGKTEYYLCGDPVQRVLMTISSVVKTTGREAIYYFPYSPKDIKLRVVMPQLHQIFP